MHTYTAVIERAADTGVFVAYVPGFPGAHSQGTVSTSSTPTSAK